MASVERRDNPLILKLNFSLPPGTEIIDGYEGKPRLPRPAPTPSRPVPEWPPCEARVGHWIAKYLDQLDPDTEYDQIVRTASLFGGSNFGTALSYATVFVMLTMPPAGAMAIHGGKVVKYGHRRFYETELQILNWAYYGSDAPETAAHIESINKIHASIWKRLPGSFSTLWEGQMAVVGASFFEAWMRRVVGARKGIHPKVQAAWPKWGERLVSHFRTEPSDGSRSYGINYPRTWEELEAFFFWFNSIPFNEYVSSEQRRKGHETAEAFIRQFCELWFPKNLSWLGRQVILTFIPPNCRYQQQLGDPNVVISFLIKVFFKIMFDIKDALPDPVDPPLVPFRQSLIEADLRSIDMQIRSKRDKEHNVFMAMLSMLMVGFLSFSIFKFHH